MVCGRVFAGSTDCGIRHPWARTTRRAADAHTPANLLGASSEPGRIIAESNDLRDVRALGRHAGATRMSSFRVQGVGWERLSAPLRLHPLQVAEDGARIDPEVLGRLGPVAAVPLQHLVDVTLLPLVARLSERQ